MKGERLCGNESHPQKVDIGISDRVPSAVSQASMVKLLMIGDSDIDFWPRDLLPALDGLKLARTNKISLVVRGYSGATLAEIVSQMKNALTAIFETTTGNDTGEALVIVACAGENDIGNRSSSLDYSVSALQSFLDVAFSMEERAKSLGVIFLGPKFEPWQEDDPSSKKQYSIMSRAFARCCLRHRHADRIRYIDCLTMFCGVSAGLPGATLVGRARAETKFFALDGLHLSPEGYKTWKRIVENRIRSLACQT